jgi:large subunit ribosomal protein L21
MVSYAIAEACGKQFWLEEGRFYDFNKLPLDKGDLFTLNNVLLVNNGDSVFFGAPYLDKEYTVNVEVLRHIKGPKVRVYKMRPKKKTRKTFGSKLKFTRVLIKSIIKNT